MNLPPATGLLDQARIDVDKAKLGPAEHPQRPVGQQVAPDQPEVAVIADAATNGR